MSKQALLELEQVQHTYFQGGNRVDVLNNINFKLYSGDLIALVASSGAGKSTLLHLSGLLERPTGGNVLINNVPMSDKSEQVRTQTRRENISFIYQFHHLLSEFTALENVMMPLRISGVSQAEASVVASEFLERVGLLERQQHRPAMLSGGEQQRVALCRALVSHPRVLLADEPTGNLDTHTTDEVFAMILDCVRRQGLGAIIATHNMSLAQRMDRIITLEDGQIKEIR